MPWVRVDDQFYNHPKVAGLGALMLPCVGLHVFALCWCNAYLTDGFIPEQQLSKLVGDLSVLLPEGDYPPLVSALLSSGLWEESEGGYQIHDFLDYNPSRREVLQLRKTRAKVGQAGGIASAKQRASKRTPSPDQKSTPSPSPSPSPSEKEPKNLAGDSAPAGIGAPQKPDRKQPDPRVRAVIAAWHDGFKAKFGEPPPVNGAKAGAIAKRLLTGRSEEQAVGLVREFLRSPPDFYAQRRLYGLEHVLAAAPSLLAKKGERRLEKKSRLCPACGEGHLWRGDVRLDACPQEAP